VCDSGPSDRVLHSTSKLDIADPKSYAKFFSDHHHRAWHHSNPAMLARPSRPFIALSKRFASTKVPRTSFQAVRHSKVISPANLKPAPPPAKPKVELPLNLPEEWSHGNRALKPGLLAAVREEYKEKIITKQPEPLWSRVILFIQLISVTCIPLISTTSYT